MACIEQLAGKKVIFATASSMLKAVDGAEFDVGKRTTAATKLADGDRLLLAGIYENGDTVVMQSKKNLFLRIDAADVPEKKKAALGVRGMKLAAGDELEAAYLLHSGDNLTVNVGGKNVALTRLRIGTRDTKGVKR